MIADLWALAPVAWARLLHGRAAGRRLLGQALLLGVIFGGPLLGAWGLLLRRAAPGGGGVGLVLGATGALGVLALGAAGNAPGRPAWPLLPVPPRVRAWVHLGLATVAPVLAAALVAGAVCLIFPAAGGGVGSGLAPVDGGAGGAPGRVVPVARELGLVLLGAGAMAVVHLNLARLGAAAAQARAPGLVVLAAMLGPGFVASVAGVGWGAATAGGLLVGGLVRAGVRGAGVSGAGPAGAGWRAAGVGEAAGAGPWPRAGASAGGPAARLGAPAWPVELAWLGWVLRAAAGSTMVVPAGLGLVLLVRAGGDEAGLTAAMLPWLWSMVVAAPLSSALGGRSPGARRSPLTLLPLSGRRAQALVAALAAGGSAALVLVAGEREPAALLAAVTSGVTLTLLLGASHGSPLWRQVVLVALFVLLPLPVQLVAERGWGAAAWPGVALPWSGLHLLVSTALLTLRVRT